ncbi:hypothetical protein [Bartonella saheliensis]|uniref:hypothetical protein n=1 Tax=Bartonella saheliensis TaxID=1457016 RepID=UPI0011A6859A|nr:hypothetical protein [Bartonella saheliensis]
MKEKNSTFYNELINLSGKEYSSVRECFVICLLSLMIELGNRTFFLPLLESQEQLTGGQVSSFFLAVCELWTVIGVGVVVLTPVMVILYIILWCLLLKKARILNKINEQRGRITLQQKRYKKGAWVKMDEIFVMILGLVFIFVTAWFAVIPMMILQLYYGVFKLARRYFCLKKELKSLLKEQETAFEKS